MLNKRITKNQNDEKNHFPDWRTDKLETPRRNYQQFLNKTFIVEENSEKLYSSLEEAASMILKVQLSRTSSTECMIYCEHCAHAHAQVGLK